MNLEDRLILERFEIEKAKYAKRFEMGKEECKQLMSPEDDAEFNACMERLQETLFVINQIDAAISDMYSVYTGVN